VIASRFCTLYTVTFVVTGLFPPVAQCVLRLACFVVSVSMNTLNASSIPLLIPDAHRAVASVS
jgi:hypothetical protein